MEKLVLELSECLTVIWGVVIRGINLKDITENLLEWNNMPINLERNIEKGLVLTSCTNETKAYIYSRGRITVPFGMITTDENVGGHKYASSCNTSISRMIGYWTSQTPHHTTYLKISEKAISVIKHKSNI